MEAAMTKTALLYKLRICRLDIGRSHNIPYLIDKDIVEPIGVVEIAAELAVFRLLCFKSQQSHLNAFRSGSVRRLDLFFVVSVA